MFVFGARRRHRDGITLSMAVTVFGMRLDRDPVRPRRAAARPAAHGAALLIDVLVGTFVTDTSAYAAGRLFGRHRSPRRCRPNKTIEGLIGGFLGGTLGFWFAGLYQDWLSGLDALHHGRLQWPLLAPLGDLFESMIKRDLGVKDSGTLFGPHGGLLDRLDAVLFTVVVGLLPVGAFVY